MAQAQEENKRKFPHEIEDMDPKLNHQFCKHFQGEHLKFVCVGPGKLVIASRFREDADDYYNFKLRSDDIFICGYPRSGTTLSEEIAWFLANGQHKSPEDTKTIVRAPWLEGKTIVPYMGIELTKAGPTSEVVKSLLNHVNALEILEAKPEDERRVTKTHLHFGFLPPDLLADKRKVIYMARNPMDVCMSFFKLQTSVAGRPFVGSLEDYYNNFRNDIAHFTPYWSHIAQGWALRHSPHVKFIFYEDLTTDLRAHIRDIADFLEIDLNEDKLDEIIASNYFGVENFKKFVGNTLGSENFVRKGVTGEWRSNFSEQMSADCLKWFEENCQQIGIKFPQN